MRFQLLLSLTAMVTVTHAMGIPTNENAADTLVGEVMVRPPPPPLTTKSCFC